MNDYTGKTCPFCKTNFKPDDELVVCSECDMPHHKDCWIENRGCTTFGCPGTIKNADHTATSVTRTHMNYDDGVMTVINPFVYCTKCGAQNESTASYCSKCGNRLATAFQQEQQASVCTQANDANAALFSHRNQQRNYYPDTYKGHPSNQSVNLDSTFEQLIGPKSEYYMPVFQDLIAQNKQTSWNWSAFLVAPYWMIYRKMYAYGAIYLIINFLLVLIMPSVSSLISLAESVALGVFANYLYMRFIENKASKATAMSEAQKMQFVIQNGGTNSTATVIAVAAYIMIVLLTQ